MYIIETQLIIVNGIFSKSFIYINNIEFLLILLCSFNRTKEFLRDAILNNDFMKNLEMDQIMSIVDCMYPLEHPNGDLIIKEGDIGNRVYIMEGNLIGNI